MEIKNDGFNKHVTCDRVGHVVVVVYLSSKLSTYVMTLFSTKE